MNDGPAGVPPEDAPHNEAPPTDIDVTFSEAAAAKIREVMAAQGDRIAGVRITLAGRGPEGFAHGFALVLHEALPEGDASVEVDGILTFLEARNVAYLNGVGVDYEANESGIGGLFTFANPNPMWRDELSMRIQYLFDNAINPQIAAHGGMVNLIEVVGDIAYVELGGGCQGCNLANVTLKQGIEAAVLEYVPEISEVRDTTDHASGDNPYYRPSKK
ncbi:MAG: NifU family protein [Dehalococcoidia bacterium]|nr:NifU family protein [Dehalococcoidia bacterium]